MIFFRRFLLIFIVLTVIMVIYNIVFFTYFNYRIYLSIFISLNIIIDYFIDIFLSCYKYRLFISKFLSLTVIICIGFLFNVVFDSWYRYFSQLLLLKIVIIDIFVPYCNYRLFISTFLSVSIFIEYLFRYFTQ